MRQSFALQFTSPNYPFVGFLLLKCRLGPHSSSGPYILDLAIFADLALANLKTKWWIFGLDLVGPILTSLAHNTHSLFYRVYKSRYFPNCSFMDAE